MSVAEVEAKPAVLCGGCVSTGQEGRVGVSGSRALLSGYLLELAVSKNLNFSEICFVILTLALATFNFSLFLETSFEFSSGIF